LRTGLETPPVGLQREIEHVALFTPYVAQANAAYGNRKADLHAKPRLAEFRPFGKEGQALRDIAGHHILDRVELQLAKSRAVINRGAGAVERFCPGAKRVTLTPSTWGKP
jgi:hypothetical protein